MAIKETRANRMSALVSKQTSQMAKATEPVPTQQLKTRQNTVPTTVVCPDEYWQRSHFLRRTAIWNPFLWGNLPN